MTPRTPSPFLAKLKALFTTSVFLTALERFTEAVYTRLTNGIFSAIFTAYPQTKAREPSPWLKRILDVFRTMRHRIAQSIDECFAAHLLRLLINYLLRCRLRVYGTFILTLGVYSCITSLFSLFGSKDWDSLTFGIISLVLIGAAIPLLFSRESLSQALLSSCLAQPVLAILGIRRESLCAEGSTGRSNLAFAAGMLLGFTTFFIPLPLLLLGIVGILLAYRVLVSPETGVVALFFCMPFLPTMMLVMMVCYIIVCYAFKLLLGKRKFHLQTVDTSAALFAFAIACSGVFSFSTGSRKPALVLICFLLSYFLTVFMLRTREWMMRCTWAAITAASLVGLYGIFQYFSGSLGEDNAWLDSDMFQDIAGRVVSTLENPNMLAEYLILLFPLAAAQLLIRRGAVRKACALMACGAIGLCIILTWSRGAWLGLIFCGLIFLLIWNRRTIYLLLAGVISIPFLPILLPDSIVSRFTSIGNIADTSTSYRVNIWRGAVHMLGDYWSCGIGIGEAAWDTVYPRYSLAAIETAPHAHNLYLQIWVEMGIVGVLLFLTFLILLLMYHFTYYHHLGDMRTILDVSARLKQNDHSPTTITTRSATVRTTNREITALRLEAAAPMCGLIATLVQGFTDYTWYNYRVYLMFWLIAGLSVAYVRCGQAELTRIRGQENLRLMQPSEASLDLPLSPKTVNKS